MAPEVTPDGKMVGLPVSIVGPVDLGRLIRELENLDSALMQSNIRGDTDAAKLPKTTTLMDQTLSLNKIELSKATDRKRLHEFLVDIREQAPTMHVSFSTDPSPLFLDKLVTWLRKEMHPLLLLTVGIQPNIGAGCVVRTTNKYFDFSLRQHFSKQTALLMKELSGAKS